MLAGSSGKTRAGSHRPVAGPFRPPLPPPPTRGPPTSEPKINLSQVPASLPKDEPLIFIHLIIQNRQIRLFFTSIWSSLLSKG